jgi:monooxygenase
MQYLASCGPRETVHCIPIPPADMPLSSETAFTSGYLQRAAPILPKQGPRDPWIAHNNFFRDYWLLAGPFAKINDGVLRFVRTRDKQKKL